jgi:hypothetical protein
VTNSSLQVKRARRTYAISVAAVWVSSAGLAAFWVFGLFVYMGHGGPTNGSGVTGSMTLAITLLAAGVTTGCVALSRRGPGRGYALTAVWLGAIPLAILVLPIVGRVSPFGL